MVCAPAIIRLVPSIRWDAEKVGVINVTPLDFKTHTQDVIEEDPEPHSHAEPNPDDGATRAPKRLKIFDSDLKNVGYTENCQRCTFVQRGQSLRARGTRHSEECRKRLYEAMREAGTEKLKRADHEDANRTQTQSKKFSKKREEVIEEFPNIDAPMEPIDDTMSGEDSDKPVLEPVNEPDATEDTCNFYEEVNDDIGRVKYEGPDRNDPEHDHIMSSMMNVLQT